MADLVKGNLEIAAEAKPEIIVDGLGKLNPDLAVDRYPELHIEHYDVAGRTASSIVYVIKR
jgi:hypothetical protein